MTLALLGAEVIKVQPKRGAPDQGRWPLSEEGASLFWHELNKAKQTVTWDFSDTASHEAFVDLLAHNGRILISSLPLPDPVSIVRLKERIPDLIVLELQGHPDGSPAVDYTVQAMTGWPEATGPSQGAEPINNPVPTWDIATGYLAAVSVLAAVDRRRRTGAGAHIRLALTDVALSTMCGLGLAAEVALTGATTRARFGNNVYGTFGQDFQTRDGHRVMVVAVTRRQWTAFVNAIGVAADLAKLSETTGLKLDDEGHRFRLREEIRLICAPWFLDRDVDGIAAVLDRAGILWSRYRSIAEALSDPSRFTHGTDIVETIDHPGVPPVPTAGLPLRLVDEPRLATAPSPEAVRASAHDGDKNMIASADDGRRPK